MKCWRITIDADPQMAERYLDKAAKVKEKGKRK